MKLAILSDVHANREALLACLSHARREGAQSHVFLGDMVGYGADPHACLDVVRRHAAEGAIVVRGNHDDAALGGLCADMNFEAREAAIWTRRRLSAAEKTFLSGLPYVVERDDELFVHASAEQPAAWKYIVGTVAAKGCLAATDAAIVFAGHVHHPMLFFSAGKDVSSFVPRDGVPVPLTKGRRWLVLAGSVGQPRDGNPAAAYLLYDTIERQVTFFRVPYDWMSAAAKIRAAGLPEAFAARLEFGR